MSASLLDLKIQKRFGDFSLQCEAHFGQGVTAIFGPSGSGKSTLLNSIAGLIKPDEGEIRFDGQVLYSSANRVHMPPEKRRFGYVFQDSALFPHMSVADNIAYGYKLTARTQARIEPSHLVELLGLGSLLERGIRNLSGGERQRVALARALAISPRLLLLDEPLASLDGGLRGVIIGYLKRIQYELHIPMVYVSHSIDEVIALADSVLVLLNGSVRAYLPASEALAHPQVWQAADYAGLENLLDVVVIHRHSNEDLAELKVGSVRMLATGVRRSEGEALTISIRAGDIIVSRRIPPEMSARNIIQAQITDIHRLGSRIVVYADVGVRIMVEITQNSLESLDLHQGVMIYLIIKANSIIPLDTD